MTICRTWGQHVVSMLYDVICSRIFYFILPSFLINVVTIPSDLWLMWQCDQSLLTLTLVVLKIENEKKKKSKIKLKTKKWSPLLIILTCISTNTYCFETYYILLEMDWWALFNTSLIVQICWAVHEILVDKAFTATDGLISQSFVVTFVYPTYVQIALIWGFPAQLSLWKLVYWLWRYKLNEVCDIVIRLFNIHWLLSSTICHFCFYLVVVLSFHRLISLSYWGNCHFPFFKHF